MKLFCRKGGTRRFLRKDQFTIFFKRILNGFTTIVGGVLYESSNKASEYVDQ